MENALANKSLVTSSQLLEMQPALGVMMGSLNTAREQLSINEGRYMPLHPALKASREAVKHQEKMLFNSLEPTLAGVDSQIAMAESRVERLDNSIGELEDKLVELTEQRVPYAKLQEDVMNKTKVHSDVQAKLSQVRSYTNSSENIGLLTRVGEPQVGSRPNGLGKKALVLVGLLGGLLVGLGLVALAVPPSGYTMAYQPVMMPVGGAQMAPVSNNPVQAAPRREGPSTPPPPTQAGPTVNDTVSESRLKSVAHQEQMRKQIDAATPANSGSTASLMSNNMESAIPESVAKHMADLKNKTKAVLTPSTTPAPQPNGPTPGQRAEVSSADVVSAIKTAQTKATGKAGAVVAGAAAAAATVAAAAASSAANLVKPASSPSEPKPEKTPSQSVESIQQQLRELDATEARNNEKEKLRALDPTIAQPDIVVVERKKTKTMAPEVPDSVAAGRITAESLIESSARRVQGQTEEQDPSAAVQPRQNVHTSPVDTSILQKVKAELDDPSDQTPATRTPSISDYARSLEDGTSTNQNPSEPQDPSDSTLPMERRPANVRPVDIAKSLAENDSVRGIVDDIRPNESDSGSTGIANQGTTESPAPAKVLDNSLVGLMREARNSNPEVVRRKADSDVSAADLKPTPKTPEKPPATPQAKPKPPGDADSDAIPQQIKQLSDSFSTFARPNRKNSGPKE